MPSADPVAFLSAKIRRIIRSEQGVPGAANIWQPCAATADSPCWGFAGTAKLRLQGGAAAPPQTLAFA